MRLFCGVKRILCLFPISGFFDFLQISLKDKNNKRAVAKEKLLLPLVLVMILLFQYFKLTNNRQILCFPVYGIHNSDNRHDKE